MEVRNENYVKNSLKSILKINGIYTVHYFKYGKNFTVLPEQHDFWEMVYVDSGEVGIIADDKEFTLKQGEAYFQRPNELHTIYTPNSCGNTAIISFECAQRTINYFANKIFVLGDFEKGLLGKIIKETPKCFSDKLNEIYLTKMTKRKDAPLGSEQIIKNCIELMLLSLLRKDIEKDTVKNVKENVASLHSDKIVTNIIKLLNERLYTSIDLDTIAKELFFSKTYIKTVFKKNMNTSIIQYYIFLKIEESKKLISQNKYTYTEIAYMLGFNSVHYFSRLFKAHTQMTPSEYSKSIKADNLL